MVMAGLERSRIDKDPDEVAKRVLQTNFTTLRGKINITNIRCHLYEQRAIDTNIYDKLMDTNATVNYKSELLLRHLISQGEEGYRHLIQALHQCGKEDAVQASLANDLEQCYKLECCNDGGMVKEARDSRLTSINNSDTMVNHHDTPTCTRQRHMDHGGRGSESSSLSSNLRTPSSIGHQISGQISMASGSEQSYAGSTTIQVDDVATVKILVLGDKGVGKTSLILKYAKNDFDIHKSPTVTLDVISSAINANNKKYIINFWDPAGQSRPNTLTRRYFQGAHGALLLYDCTRPTTLDSIVNWQKELNERVYQRNGNPLPTILIGTKCDHESCDEEPSGGSSMCHEYGFLNHFLVSAKTSKNLKRAVDSLLLEIIGDADSLKETHYNDEHSVVVTLSDSSVEVQQQNSHAKNKCCS